MGKRTYYIEMSGTITVEAESEEEARQLAWEEMSTDAIQPVRVTEGECAYCDGTGEVATDEDDGEGHIMRGVGTQKCVCQTEE